MYKAKIEIGGYKIGEEVPAEKAEVWKTMYKESPVEKVEENKTIEKSKSVKEEDSKNNSKSILHDYLGRNKNVLKKNIAEDDLSKKDLKELFDIEKTDKKRKVVLDSIKRRLNSFN